LGDHRSVGCGTGGDDGTERTAVLVAGDHGGTPGAAPREVQQEDFYNNIMVREQNGFSSSCPLRPIIAV
jgi:predicted AlkP superfamily pyrophosphatase or phosphodiesterase